MQRALHVRYCIRKFFQKKPVDFLVVVYRIPGKILVRKDFCPDLPERQFFLCARKNFFRPAIIE